MSQIFTKTEKELIKAGLAMVSERSFGLGEDIQAIYGKLNQAPALVRIDMITVKKCAEICRELGYVSAMCCAREIEQYFGLGEE